MVYDGFMLQQEISQKSLDFVEKTLLASLNFGIGWPLSVVGRVVLR